MTINFDKFRNSMGNINRIIYIVLFVYSSFMIIYDKFLLSNPKGGSSLEPYAILLVIDTPMLLFILSLHRNQLTKEITLINTVIFTFVNYGLLWLFLSRFFK
jgi:hypothetical protein